MWVVRFGIHYVIYCFVTNECNSYHYDFTQIKHTELKTRITALRRTKEMSRTNSPFILIIVMKKKILNIIEDYLRIYPTPSQITPYGQLFKLNYTYSSPFTDSKQTKEVIVPNRNSIITPAIFESNYKKISYNEKGRIQESNSFDSVLTKDKHQKLLDDDVFGRPQHNWDYSRWIYAAEIKQEPVKSYFNEGKGKEPFKYDFGQGYEGVKEAGLFLWDKKTKKVFKVELDKGLIPSSPSFYNEEGTQIIFHAYKKQNFGHGILHCLNRPVSVYHAKLSLTVKQSEKGQQVKGKKEQYKLQAEVTKLIEDGQQTNIFPAISPCYNYLVYLSGTGITHTYYLDYVIMKRVDGQWMQIHRLKQQTIGFYDSLRSYLISQGEKVYAIAQTSQKHTMNIYKIDVQTAQITNLTSEYKHSDFSISNVGKNGLITGILSTFNFNTFYYTHQNQIQMIDPPQKENFVIREYSDPIHIVTVQANEQDIYEQFKARVNQRPIVVMFHGGPHGSFSPALTSLRYSLLKMGYVLLFPNFHGSTGYGQDFIKGALKGIGQKDVKPFLTQLQQILSQNKNYDKSNVHSFGGSYGGYLTAIMGTRYPSYFKSAIIMNGVLNNIAMLFFTDIPEWVTAETLAKSELHNLTAEDYIQLYRQSPTSNSMKIPTLQFLGAKDLRVPHKQGLLFDAITKQVGTPITTYVYQNSAHGLSDSVQTSIDIVAKCLFFLEGIKDEEQSK